MGEVHIGDEKGAIEAMQTKHKIALYTPPKAQIEELQAKMKPYWESWAKKHGKDAVAQLKEIRAALGN